MNANLKNRLLCLTAKLVFLATVSSASSIDVVLNPMNCVICRILTVLLGISAGVAVVVIILAGIKWTASAEDPGARAQAKTTIVNAIVGLIIVAIAIELVGWIVSSADGFDFDTSDWTDSSCNTFCS